jgi:predicted ATPase
LEFEDDLTVIVAENGKGKSAILDALVVAVGPYLGCFNGTKTYNFEDNDVMQVQEDKNGDKLRILRMQRHYRFCLKQRAIWTGKKLSGGVSCCGKAAGLQ